jgi:pSer/pThr/pTyr-binding forkhead associated (FHA) protein
MAQNIRLTRDLNPPEAEGNHHRLLCMTGKNKGICYYLKGKRVVMGRGDTSDIQILDTKSSREHVEIKLIGSDYILTDLGSHNGVIINDLKVTQHKLANGDKIIIGQTVYKYNLIIVKNEIAVIDEEADFDDEDEEEEEVVPKKKPKKKGSNKRVLIYGGVALVLAMLFLDGGETDKGNKKKKGQMNVTVDKELTSSITAKKSIEDKEEKAKINAYIHRGQREFREGNYFRAIQEFEKALIIFPNHGYASALKRTAQQRLDEDIKIAMLRASRDLESLKYESAIINYCSVVRLLKDYGPKEQRYKDAETQIALIEEKLGKDEGDIKCF